MTELETRMEQVSLDRQTECFGLRLEPAGKAVWVYPGREEMTRKEYERSRSLLKGCLALLRGEKAGVLELTAGMLPAGEGEEGLFSVWYAQSGEGTLHERLMAVYNGFAALPGAAGGRKAAMERWLGVRDADRLEAYAQACRRADDDADAPVPDAPHWMQEEVTALRRKLFAAGRESYSGKNITF